MSYTLVFEINDALVSKRGGKYLSAYVNDQQSRPAKSNGAAWNAIISSLAQFRIMQDSDRVWIESDSGVRFEKNRFQDRRDDVDLDEFFWVKLQSKPISLTS